MGKIHFVQREVQQHWFMGHCGPIPQPSRMHRCRYGRFLNPSLLWHSSFDKLQTMQPHFKLIDSRQVTYMPELLRTTCNYLKIDSLYLYA